MKVCFKNIRGHSGADVWMTNLARALEKLGVETSLYFFNNNYQYFPFPLKAIDKTTKHDVIHTSTWNGFAFKKENIPLVVTEHHVVHDPVFNKYKSFPQKVFHKLVYQYEKKSLRVADSITCYSEYTKKQTKSIFGYNANKIYAGVDTDMYYPKKTEDKFIEFARDKIKLLFVGNMSRRKGFDLLPKIMKKLDNRFILFSTSGLRKDVVKKYDDNFFLIGSSTEEEMINYYNLCDIFLFPSRLEGFGLAVAEAMACAKPVVTTNCSSLPELIVDKKGGFLCEMDNVDEFVEKINLLAKSHSTREKMGEFNRKMVEDKFSIMEVAKEYLKLYESLIN